MRWSYLGTVGWRRRIVCRLPHLRYFLWSFFLVTSYPFVVLPYYQERYEEMCRALESGLKDLGLNTNLTIAQLCNLGEDTSLLPQMGFQMPLSWDDSNAHGPHSSAALLCNEASRSDAKSKKFWVHSGVCWAFTKCLDYSHLDEVDRSDQLHLSRYIVCVEGKIQTLENRALKCGYKLKWLQHVLCIFPLLFCVGTYCNGLRQALSECLLHCSLEFRVIMPLTDSPQAIQEPSATAITKLTNIKKNKTRQRCSGSIGALLFHFWENRTLKKPLVCILRLTEGLLVSEN